MPSVETWTYRDLMDHVVDFLGSDVSAEADRDSRRAVQQAVRELANSHSWSLYYNHGRIVTNAPFTDGTIAYTDSTRQLLLSGASWPSWSGLGEVVINSNHYDVGGQVSSSVLTLASATTVGADLPAGTSYRLDRNLYPMPYDFIACDDVIIANQSRRLQYAHPREWLINQRTIADPSVPWIFSFVGDPHYLGTVAMALYPAPDQAYNLDFIYRRRPRPLVIDDYATGTVTTNAGSTTITGANSIWKAKHVGTVLRLAADGLNLPTSRFGDNPFEYERVVASVDSPTQITVDASIPETLTGVKYRLSDPVDVEDGAMLQALLRCCEFFAGLARNKKDRPLLEDAWQKALRMAQMADARFQGPRQAGPWLPYRPRLARMPAGPDLG